VIVELYKTKPPFGFSVGIWKLQCYVTLET